eukprot:gene27000-27229_t
MLLIGHAGTKYGIPYAVLARASFGTGGAKLPALMRAIVACGWYGIQTWFGGQMIYTLLGVMLGGEFGGAAIAGLGINGGQLLCFLVFWAIQFWYIVHGMESIRKLETYTAPLKILICFVLLGWVYSKAGGFGDLLSAPSQFVEGGKKAGQFWSVFWPSLTAMVGFWATLALNIPDFTRFAKSQRDQVIGQSVGLPVPMGLLAMMAVIVMRMVVRMIVVGDSSHRLRFGNGVRRDAGSCRLLRLNLGRGRLGGRRLGDWRLGDWSLRGNSFRRGMRMGLM